MSISILVINTKSIGGRLTLSSLCDGFQKLGCHLDTYDPLYKGLDPLNFLSKKNNYDFLLGYDYSAIKFKVQYKLNIPSISYFSD